MIESTGFFPESQFNSNNRSHRFQRHDREWIANSENPFPFVNQVLPKADLSVERAVRLERAEGLHAAGSRLLVDVRNGTADTGFGDVK